MTSYLYIAIVVLCAALLAAEVAIITIGGALHEPIADLYGIHPDDLREGE